MRFVELKADSVLKLPDEIARLFNPPEMNHITENTEALSVSSVFRVLRN